MFTIDTSTSLGSRVAKRLADELIFWLTTVGRSGAPHPNPVWFLWTGSEMQFHQEYPVLIRITPAKLRGF
jgi:hypothetical protein